MKRFALAALLLIPGVLFAALDPAPQSLSFDVLRNGSKVGSGHLAVLSVPRSGQVEVDYRLSINVKLGFISAYSLERQQFGVFDRDGSLLYARSSGRTNGDGLELEACSHGRHEVKLRVNGEERTLGRNEYAMTTLHPFIQPPATGVWLDLGKGSLVNYKVTSRGDQYVLEEGVETHHLVKDERGILEALTIETPKGDIEMKRTAMDTAGLKSLFDPRRAAQKVEQCRGRHPPELLEK